MSTRPVSGAVAPTPVISPKRAAAGAIASAYASEKDRRKDIAVELQYLKDDPLYKTVKPLQITPNFADKEGRTNVRLAPGPPETLVDVRGLEHGLSLDDNGFTYVKEPTKFKDWSSQPKIAQEYLPELEDLLRRHVGGCDEIMFYDARIRQDGDDGARVQGLSYNPFARQVHVDNTERSVLEKIRNLTDMKADYLLSGRARIINIWRPIKHPVYDCGLAIADGGELQQGDIIECDRHRQDTGSYWDTMGVVQYRNGFRWYYCSEQAEEDVLLFKNYDSATDVSARTVLHTAFDLPPENVPPNAPTRESIEVRALIFTYPANGRRPSGAVQQHPLALHLEQSDLKSFHDEQSITDRLRTDIDEGKEVKDAILILRRQEIRRLERVRDGLFIQQDNLRAELAKANSENEKIKTDMASAQQQLSIQTKRVHVLEDQVRSLEQQLAPAHPNLHGPHSHSPKMTDLGFHEPGCTHSGVKDDAYGHHEHNYDQLEKRLLGFLLRTIERQEQEIQKWRGEAMVRDDTLVRDNETANRC